MKRKHRCVAIGAVLLLFLTLCVLAFSSASAEDAKEPMIVPAEQVTDLFRAQTVTIWVKIVALALGVIGVSALVCMTISNARAVRRSEEQLRLLMNLCHLITEGVAIKSPVIAELRAWPKEGHVLVSSEALEQLAAIARLGGVFAEQPGAQALQPSIEPPAPLREGEEPELLALANRLAGVASAPEWNDIVREAGWRAVQLQSNPTEKGTYVVDESGYSIISCLMHISEPELAYVVPSYQDPNASESRWSEFYFINEDIVVKHFRVQALPVMYIARETFFLLKSKGRLTRRPQYY